jgi:hypothetical protein
VFSEVQACLLLPAVAEACRGLPLLAADIFFRGGGRRYLPAAR